MEHYREGDLILVRLDRGEDVLGGLMTALKAEGARGGVMLSALGGVDEVEVGTFDLSRKAFDRARLEGLQELLGLTGIIAAGPDGTFQPHLHITVAGPDRRAVGGHFFKARVAVLGEFALRVLYNPSARREKEPEFGLNALRLR